MSVIPRRSLANKNVFPVSQPNILFSHADVLSVIMTLFFKLFQKGKHVISQEL